jgi:phage terminase large subunit GpA-like protein
MELTDKRVWFAPCHLCGEAVALDGRAWGQVKWCEDESRNHPVYGIADPESAYFECPHCLGHWSDAERARNSRAGEFRATAPFTGLAGAYVCDLMSSAPGAALPRLVEKYLEAKHKEAAGDATGLIEFYNNQLGLAFRYRSPAPAEDELEARAEDYAELTVPWPGLRLTAGVDVQGDRVELSVVAWGRGEESWRVYFGAIYGNVVDHDDPVWTELEHMLFRPYLHASGAELFVEATSIDSSDDNTSDAVYWFCRKHRHRGVMAIKGVEQGEIFRMPKPIDPSGRATKAARYGLHVYLVGTEKAKDLILGFGEHGGRLRLSTTRDGRVATGNGPGRMHWYRGIRGDWYKQVTSEVKAPMRGRPRNRLYWQVKAGVRNEALDVEIYSLHAARRLRVNLMTEAQWMMIEARLRQPGLLSGGARGDPLPAEVEKPAAVEPPTLDAAVRPAEEPAPRKRLTADAALLAQLTPGRTRALPDVGDPDGPPY